jgi:hypothetical protein
VPVHCLPISIFSPQEIAAKIEYVARLCITDNHGRLPEPIGILNLMWVLKGWTIERCTIVWLCVATTGWTTVKLEGPAGTSTWGLETNARGTPLIGVTFTCLSWRCPQHSVIVKFSSHPIFVVQKQPTHSSGTTTTSAYHWHCLWANSKSYCLHTTRGIISITISHIQGVRRRYP